MFESIIAGLAVAFSMQGFLFILLGVVLGIILGATPGFSPSMGVALLVPLSFGMDPLVAFPFFVAVYQASNYGGSITAVLLNAPGTPASVVTALDGYQLSKRGESKRALAAALSASALGGAVGAVVLILFAIPIAHFGLAFGPPEYFALGILGLSTVVGFSGKSPLKAAVGTCFGLFLSTVGADPFTSEERFTLGFFELFDGFSFIPVMIGLFALGEIFGQIADPKAAPKSAAKLTASIDLRAVFSALRFPKVFAQSSLLGAVIGVVPGAGATIASFISHSQARRFSKKPDELGKGSEEGVVASEAANSASVGGALIPLLSLGIPGSATDAVLLGAFVLHGLVAGPELFQTDPELVYGIFMAVFLANILILILGTLGNRFWLSIASLPREYLFPTVIALCLVGSYTIRNSLFDSGVCLAFGLIGWLGKRAGYHPAPIVLGMVLGEMIEMNLRRSLLLGGFEVFYSSPLASVLLLVSVSSLLFPALRRRTSIAART